MTISIPYDIDFNSYYYYSDFNDLMSFVAFDWFQLFQPYNDLITQWLSKSFFQLVIKKHFDIDHNHQWERRKKKKVIMTFQ